jgi:hypothetical protein
MSCGHDGVGIDRDQSFMPDRPPVPHWPEDEIPAAAASVCRISFSTSQNCRIKAATAAWRSALIGAGGQLAPQHRQQLPLIPVDRAG